MNNLEEPCRKAVCGDIPPIPDELTNEYGVYSYLVTAADIRRFAKSESTVYMPQEVVKTAGQDAGFASIVLRVAWAHLQDLYDANPDGDLHVVFARITRKYGGAERPLKDFRPWRGSLRDFERLLGLKEGPKWMKAEW
ncbi:uncharacterized protein BXZ73DRAFT_103244 [Epithele typhae]|uniref:uncharacterized protein n=1 Tax=Epithele typhae TaxID=378194 RepID=UPI002007B565|nr:uncharacterized protein BXZ73DRAFT_103244 [Epithele typhae]KAH9925359.1 hypothetical protein BXZ73DRAFT_103244 [Epithele typhae]